ncbi:MAG: hypothetical protein JNL36_00395 [Candidatus Kapabacteria bacterium]|nr:hypothetical protein [Candidatus Kapabacteria bacterium]
MMLLNLTKLYSIGLGNCPPEVTGDIYTVKFVSKTQCTKEMSCLSELAFDDAIHCDNHNLASKYIILNGRAFWRELYKENCGFKCCLVEMRVKCAVSPVTGNIVPTFLPRNYITTSNCPTSTTYRCTDGIVPPPPPVHVPCEGDDCQKGKLE